MLHAFVAATQLTFQDESQTQPNIERDSHVPVPSGDSQPYATWKPSVASTSPPETAVVVAFTSGSAARMNPISRMLRQAPFPEHRLGQAYLANEKGVIRREKMKKKTNGRTKERVGEWPWRQTSTAEVTVCGHVFDPNAFGVLCDIACQGCRCPELAPAGLFALPLVFIKVEDISLSLHVPFSLQRAPGSRHAHEAHT